MDISSQNFEKKQEYLKENEELECISLHILHDVEADTIIETSQLLIDGTTDIYSSQFSRTAKINKHRGTLRCHEAEINILDGGEVHATHVHIHNCLSGTIYAQDVIIESVEENLTVFASNSITVNLINGSHNTFAIDYKNVPILNSKLELIQHDINRLMNELEEAKKHNHSIVSKISAKIEKFEQDKTSILESYKIEKITLNGVVNENNKVIFTVNNTILEYLTSQQVYTPFYISTDNNTITLQPTTTKTKF